MELPLYRPSGLSGSRWQEPLFDYRGSLLASVSQAPPLLFSLVASELRSLVSPDLVDPAAGGHPPGADQAAGLPPPGAQAPSDVFDWLGLLPLAAERFLADLDEYVETVHLATGLPAKAVEEAAEQIAAALREPEPALRLQLPGHDLASVASGRVGVGGREYGLVPRGRLLGVVAPANHPQVHVSWVLALALGYTVLVRPGSRDPFTPLRLAQALAAVGLEPPLAILPGPHASADALLELCDVAIIYGGQQMVDRYRGRPNMQVNGPGRSKIYVDASAPGALAYVLDSMLHAGGRKCTCASGLVLQGSAAQRRALLASLEEALAAVPICDLPAFVSGAAELASALGRPELLVVEDGASYLRPSLSLRAVDFGRELPFPFLAVVELEPGVDPLPFLEDSLAVGLWGASPSLVARCLGSSTILKVMEQLPPWHTEAGCPHGGLLGDLLFVKKAHYR